MGRGSSPVLETGLGRGLFMVACNAVGLVFFLPGAIKGLFFGFPEF